jgi:hypothetical protein
MDTREFIRQSGVPSELAAGHNPVAINFCVDFSAWANNNTLAAGNTAAVIEDRRLPVVVEHDGVFPACIFTCPALDARVIRNTGERGPDNTDIFNLRLRTRVWAISESDPKLMMGTDSPFYMLFQKSGKILLFQKRDNIVNYLTCIKSRYKKSHYFNFNPFAAYRIM